jgi:hypothetical protein
MIPISPLQKIGQYLVTCARLSQSQRQRRLGDALISRQSI